MEVGSTGSTDDAAGAAAGSMVELERDGILVVATEVDGAVGKALVLADSVVEGSGVGLLSSAGSKISFWAPSAKPHLSL